MKNKTKNNDRPIGKLTIIPDFLPHPSALLPKDETIKITLSVNTDTLQFFKIAAKESGEKYQRMMREVLNGYAKKYKKGA